MYNLVVMDKFGEWLRDSRKAKHLTQDGLAKRSGVSASYISTLERNQPHSITGAILRPEPDKVERLAKALDQDVAAALILAGYSPKTNSIYPQTIEEFTEALKRFGVCKWKIPESQMAKLSPEYFKNVIDMMESLIKGQLQKMEEGEVSDLKKV